MSTTTLIVEAGGTTTTSCLISGGERTTTVSAGINPITQPDYEKDLEELCDHYSGIAIDSLHYYGAGCLRGTVSSDVQAILARLLPTAKEINVTDDLTGSARSQCGGQEGLICIIGTGSVIGYSDGHHVVDRMASGGYLLGDEGSGYQIGRELLRRYLRQQLPDADMRVMRDIWGNDSSALIQAVYSDSYPRRYVSSQANHIKGLSVETQQVIIKTVMSALVEDMVMPMHQRYPVPIHFIGSVAHYCEDYLRTLLADRGVTTGAISKAAVDGLVRYHNT